MVRPTSETIIWHTYANWIQSYRDLPLLYNQWCNIVRWEKRSRLFLERPSSCGRKATPLTRLVRKRGRKRCGCSTSIAQVSEDVLAIPVLMGRKSESERFPGAVETLPIEGLMRDRKALQCGTSHFLGQNFAKAYDVTFLNENGEQDHPWATSWGFTTRMVGATIMAHGDDKGLRLPPAVAPVQVVIVPIYRADDERGGVLVAADKAKAALSGNGIRVRIDDRDQHRPGYKFSEWELKGVPIRLEIGPRDVEADQVVAVDRSTGEKQTLSSSKVIANMSKLLDAVQKTLYQDALAFRDGEHARGGRLRHAERRYHRTGRLLGRPLVRRGRVRAQGLGRDIRNDPSAPPRARRPRSCVCRVREARNRASHLGQGLLEAVARRDAPRGRRTYEMNHLVLFVWTDPPPGIEKGGRR